MNIAFISRATLYSSPGGDTKQLDLTAHHLRQMGVQVDVYLTNQEIDYSRYDMLHFFNIIRPADILKHILVTDKPFVVSTIFVQYGEYEKRIRTGIAKVVGQVFSEDTVEYIKVIARSLLNGEKIGSREYLWWGHRKSIRYIANRAAMLLPNSHSEYKRFSSKYLINTDYRVVPNGVSTEYVNRQFGENPKYKYAVICMARIEGLKNQLNLVRALNGTKYTLYINGKPSPNGMPYYEQCRKEAADNVHIDGWVQGDDLYSAYQNAKVHVLPSYFETTGLSSLEAAVMGCNIVVTDRGDQKEYFKDFAWYCDPDSPDSIKEAIDKAYNAPYNEAFKEYILANYTWKKAAEETLKAYNTVLGKKTEQE